MIHAGVPLLPFIEKGIERLRQRQEGRTNATLPGNATARDQRLSQLNASARGLEGCEKRRPLTMFHRKADFELPQHVLDTCRFRMMRAQPDKRYTARRGHGRVGRCPPIDEQRYDAVGHWRPGVGKVPGQLNPIRSPSTARFYFAKGNPIAYRTLPQLLKILSLDEPGSQP